MSQQQPIIPGRGTAPGPYKLQRMKWVRRFVVAMTVCWAIALVFWLVLGGRAEFVSGQSPYSMTVILSGILAGLGVIFAVAAALTFVQSLSGATMERLSEGPLLNPNGKKKGTRW
ncbi:hypothetical protein BHE16_03250 [Neomicrococcus aestuarii]|uniref:Uncharacterized protein n=3 Tax=Neomicrococcus aestuarii TaxID=556325 RepID=A0A1L2ZLF8_9MICC|nr:hypothetical protein BHE16_03250 [Neomicrococcus aestuarii]